MDSELREEWDATNRARNTMLLSIADLMKNVRQLIHAKKYAEALKILKQTESILREAADD